MVPVSRHTASILIGSCLCAVLAGCAREPAGDDKVIATVSSQPITLKQFNAKVAKLPPYYRTIVEKNRKLYLDDMIIERLLYEEAVRTGVNTDPEVVDLVNEAKRKILISKFIQNEIDLKVKVPDIEARQFYESNKDDFRTPELWRASHILVPTAEEARSLKEAIRNGASFEELAKARSIDATANRGGDVGFFRAGQLIPDFERSCMKLKIGEVSDVVHTQFGYHLIKLTDKREPVAETFEKVRAAIEGEIRKKKREEAMAKLVNDLKSRYNVIVERDAFPASGDADDAPAVAPVALAQPRVAPAADGEATR